MAGGFALTRSALLPIHHLVGVVGGIIDTGRTDARVPVPVVPNVLGAASASDAIDELSAQFNAMLDRITALVEAMRESLDNVAHDCVHRWRACAASPSVRSLRAVPRRSARRS